MSENCTKEFNFKQFEPAAPSQKNMSDDSFDSSSESDHEEQDLPPPPDEFVMQNLKKFKKSMKYKKINSPDAEKGVDTVDFVSNSKTRKKKKTSQVNSDTSTDASSSSNTSEEYNKKPKKKSSRKKRSNVSPDHQGQAADLYYSTLPQNFAQNPYVNPMYSTLPGLQMPTYGNQGIYGPPISQQYYNIAPPSLSYNPGDICGPQPNMNNYTAVNEDQKNEFEVWLKGFILFIMINSLVSDSLTRANRNRS